MADNKMVDWIKHSLAEFNEYRVANPTATVDLSGANFCSANLREANFRGVDLKGADLCWADLSNADLANAQLGLERSFLGQSHRRRPDRCQFGRREFLWSQETIG